MSYTPSVQDQWAIDAITEADEVQFRMYAVKLPRFIPKVYDLSDQPLGEDGHGHEITFTNVVRMSEDTMGVVGEPIIMYGQDSYGRGGGGLDATAFSWKIYEYTATADDNYEINRGAEITTGKSFPEGNGVLYWTPAAAGLYAIELHVPQPYAPTDGPPAYGIRFVRVYEDWNAPDLIEIGDVTVQGGLQEGGYRASITYTAPDELDATRDQWGENQRIILFYKSWYLINDPDPDSETFGQRRWIDLTWNPGRDSVASKYYQPNLFFRGFVRGDSVKEDPINHTVTFDAVTVHALLALLKPPQTMKVIPELSDPERPFPVPVNTAFLKQEFYEKFIRSNQKAYDTIWAHWVAGEMYLSDPFLHLLTRHSNIATFFSFGIWQTETDSIPGIGSKADSVGSFMKEISEKRFGVQWSTRKSEFFVGPHWNLRPDESWATFGSNKDFGMGKAHITSISASRQYSDVGQVFVQSVDVKEILSSVLSGDQSKVTLQGIFRNVFRATFPEVNGGGRRVPVRNYIAFNQKQVDRFAINYRNMLRSQFPQIQTEHFWLPQLDIGQLVMLTWNPVSDQDDYRWGSGKLFVIIGASHSIKPTEPSWTSQYVLAEITHPAAAEVTPEPAIAAMRLTPLIETLPSGVYKLVTCQDMTRAGSRPLGTRTWIATDNTGGTQVSDQRSPTFFFGPTVTSVTIVLTVAVQGAPPTTVTASEVVDLSGSGPVALNPHEAIWAATDAGMLVSPDGGANWNGPNVLGGTTSNVGGAARACWAQEDGAIGYCGTAAGKVAYTYNMGGSWTVSEGSTGSPVGPHAMWGTNRRSVIFGCEDGTLWEARINSLNTIDLAKMPRWLEHTNNNRPITYVQIIGRYILVGAGEYLFIGTKDYWTKLAHFPHQIESGEARSVSARDTNISFLISLVFDNGKWEVGRVDETQLGMVWYRFNVQPAAINSTTGKDVTVSRIDPGNGAGVLAGFDGATKTYVLPNASGDLIGPGRGIPTTPDNGTAYAIKFGLDGRSVAFLGTADGLYKNLDPLGGA